MPASHCSTSFDRLVIRMPPGGLGKIALRAMPVRLASSSNGLGVAALRRSNFDPSGGGAVLHAETLLLFQRKHCAAVPSESVVPLFHVVERQEKPPLFFFTRNRRLPSGNNPLRLRLFSCETGKLCQETVRRGSATVSRPASSLPPFYKMPRRPYRASSPRRRGGSEDGFRGRGIDRGAVHGFNFIDGEFPSSRDAALGASARSGTTVKASFTV